MQMYARYKEQTIELIDHVLCSLHGLPVQGCQLESPRLQQAKHARNAKHLVSWDQSVFKCSDTNVVFRATIFLILLVRNSKRYPCIDDKTSNGLSKNRSGLYYQHLELRCY